MQKAQLASILFLVTQMILLEVRLKTLLRLAAALSIMVDQRMELCIGPIIKEISPAMPSMIQPG